MSNIVLYSVLQHLSRRWEYIASLYEAGKLDDGAGSDTREVLEDVLLRALTREYLELLKVPFSALHNKKQPRVSLLVK